MPTGKRDTSTRGFSAKFVDGLTPLPAEPGATKGKAYVLVDGREAPGLRLRVYRGGVRSFL